MIKLEDLKLENNQPLVQGFYIATFKLGPQDYVVAGILRHDAKGWYFVGTALDGHTVHCHEKSYYWNTIKWFGVVETN